MVCPAELVEARGVSLRQAQRDIPISFQIFLKKLLTEQNQFIIFEPK